MAVKLSKADVVNLTGDEKLTVEEFTASFKAALEKSREHLAVFMRSLGR